MHANEMHELYNGHHKVSPNLKVAEQSLRRRYLETTYFWTPEIGMVQD